MQTNIQYGVQPHASSFFAAEESKNERRKSPSGLESLARLAIQDRNQTIRGYLLIA